MIRVLDSFTADKIAAGEVIERPVSAVKELVENSIDAGASQIIVEIRGGGKSYMRITDDGCGIAPQEAETAFLRHATSKISSIADLDEIVSLGFRGEALASIAAVSRLTMVSRTAEEASGIKLVMHGGKVISSERTGANKGTTIIVEDLFYNTPARRKFMKSDAREASAVIELIQQFAIYYAGIKFMMISNGQTVFTTSGDGDVLAAADALYPDLHAHRLIPVEGDSVRGYVSDPGTTRTSRKGQFFFVNGRLVDSQIIEKGLIDGYSGRIFSGHPLAILFIDQDPREIDVNIHPGKREIRFLRQDEVRQNITDAVNTAVMSVRGVPEVFAPETASSETADPGTTRPETEMNSGSGSGQRSIKEYLKTLERPAASAAASDVLHTAASEVREEMPSFESGPAAPFDFSELVLKGYVFDTYIIMQGGDSLYVFDQHAAHERVFYEKFMEGYRNSTHIPQPVLTPFTIDVSADVYLSERHHLDGLRSMGYDIEDFGDRTFLVRGVPEYMTLEEADGFARGWFEGSDELRGGNGAVRDKLIMRSCKSAVKANDSLSETEISDLMKKLSECENPFSCPHGRPTFVRVTSYEIERSFRRK